ncbi:hypothetical protein E1301_Tti014799 [Triplophysa tibetana]|uniref:Uncharacterized protein n=1 Tax=Triplophysa tibetana TaxID=1572043 RepID=A0A5A9PX59_9TELE|nr:hypothetical protein E1301_Tti014799 [Triplophysa tibetana]
MKGAQLLSPPRESRGGYEPLLLRSFRVAPGAVFQSSLGGPEPQPRLQGIGFVCVRSQLAEVRSQEGSLNIWRRVGSRARLSDARNHGKRRELHRGSKSTTVNFAPISRPSANKPFSPSRGGSWL